MTKKGSEREGDSLICHLFERVMITSDEIKFNWLEIRMMFFEYQRAKKILVFNLLENWEEFNIMRHLFIQRDTEGVVLNRCLLNRRTHFSSWTNYILFPFSLLPFIGLYQMLTIGLMSMHTLVCLFDLIFFLTSSQWAYWWLIDKHGTCRRNRAIESRVHIRTTQQDANGMVLTTQGTSSSIQWAGGGGEREKKKREVLFSSSSSFSSFVQNRTVQYTCHIV